MPMINWYPRGRGSVLAQFNDFHELPENFLAQCGFVLFVRPTLAMPRACWAVECYCLMGIRSGSGDCPVRDKTYDTLHEAAVAMEQHHQERLQRHIDGSPELLQPEDREIIRFLQERVWGAGL